MSATLNELTNNPAERIKSMLSALRGSPKLLLVICGAAALSVIIALMFWAKEPDYRVLFSNISDEEGGAIVAQLGVTVGGVVVSVSASSTGDFASGAGCSAPFSRTTSR